MPKSLLDWVWLFAIGFVFLFPSLAWSGSVKPMTEEQASELMMNSGTGVGALAASSEGLLRQQLAREKECGARLVDERTIHDFSEAGYNQRALVTFVLNAPDVKDEALPGLLQLVIDAYKYEGGPKAWFANAWSACRDGA